MKIKLKVKYLILIVFGALVFIFAILPYASIELANNFNDSNKELSKSLYDNYINYPTGNRKAEAIFKKSELLAEDFGMHSIMLNGSGGGAPVDMKDMEKVIEGYEQILGKYTDSEYYRLAYKNLMDSYIYLGNQNELKDLINWGIDIDKLNEISKIYSSYRSFLNREYSNAEEKLKDIDIEENAKLKNFYYSLKGDIALAQEEYNVVKANYEKTEKNWNSRGEFYYRNPYLDRRDFLKGASFLKGENKVSGRVTFDGEGIPFVEIYVKRPGSGFRSIGENYTTITDGEGYYETPGIKDGGYDIGIGVATPLLYDKVYLQKNINDMKFDIDSDVEMDFKFTPPMSIIAPKNGTIIKEEKFEVEWRSVDKADYYTVYVVGFDDPERMEGSNIRFSIEDENGKSNIDGNKATFDLERLRASAKGGFSINEEITSPSTILGYFYPGSEYPIIVNAYDENGDMLGSTMPTMTYYDNVPSIKIDDRELTKGEELILDVNYQEAISHYKKILEEEFDNLEALEYLARIYSVNWEKEMKDIKTSLEYAKEYYRYSGEKNILDRILMEADYDDMLENKDLILGILDEFKSKDIDIDSFSYLRADMYKAVGRWEEARKEYLKEDLESVGSEIIFMDIYLGDEDLAIKRLNNNNLGIRNMNKKNLIEGIEGIKDISRENSEYIRFKDFLMRFFSREIKVQDRKEGYINIYNSIENENIKLILREIEKNNYFQ